PTALIDLPGVVDREFATLIPSSEATGPKSHGRPLRDSPARPIDRSPCWDGYSELATEGVERWDGWRTRLTGWSIRRLSARTARHAARFALRERRSKGESAEVRPRERSSLGAPRSSLRACPRKRR